MLPQAGVELSTILKNMKHIIIITGAGKGIGKAIAITLLAQPKRRTTLIQY
jgi:NAD(P)-dependent dehydrogenase (short-subunit alcohol dehydrogenase family)